MKATFGIFKGLYRGDGIYWQDGAYNVEGDGAYSTIHAARQHIDAAIIAREERQAAITATKAASGDYIPCERHGEQVTAQTPEGVIVCGLREFRNRMIDELETKYDKEILWIN